MLVGHAATALTALSLAQRYAPPVMGGFEQKFFSKEGARVALLVEGAPDGIKTVQAACSKSGLSGIIYGLSGAWMGARRRPLPPPDV